ncbi:MAG: hypothetical protein V4580_01895 [Bacteroidota bacterium]
MSNMTYIPSTDAEKGIWLANFTLKLQLYAIVLGITTAELAAIQKDNAMYQYVINLIEAFRQNLSSLTGYKNMLKHAVGQQHIGAVPVLPTMPTAPVAVAEGVFDRIPKLVARMKNSSNYNETIGSDLGIISPAVTPVDIDSLQPDLTIKLDVGRPHIKWVKGYSDAIDLYVDRNDGTGFTLLGRLLKNECIDIVSLAPTKLLDEWSYKAVYVIGNSQVGLYSKVTAVLVKKI